MLGAITWQDAALIVSFVSTLLAIGLKIVNEYFRNDYQSRDIFYLRKDIERLWAEHNKLKDRFDKYIER
jgi:hypothetical protein